MTPRKDEAVGDLRAVEEFPRRNLLEPDGEHVALPHEAQKLPGRLALPRDHAFARDQQAQVLPPTRSLLRVPGRVPKGAGRARGQGPEGPGRGEGRGAAKEGQLHGRHFEDEGPPGGAAPGKPLQEVL